MFGEKVWITFGIPVHPKGVGWSWGQGSKQASQVLPPQTRKTIPFSLLAVGINMREQDDVVLYYEDWSLSTYFWPYVLYDKAVVVHDNVPHWAIISPCASTPWDSWDWGNDPKQLTSYRTLTQNNHHQQVSVCLQALWSHLLSASKSPSIIPSASRWLSKLVGRKSSDVPLCSHWLVRSCGERVCSVL